MRNNGKNILSLDPGMIPSAAVSAVKTTQHFGVWEKRPPENKARARFDNLMGIPPHPQSKDFGIRKNKIELFFLAPKLFSRIFALGEGGPKGDYKNFTFAENRKTRGGLFFVSRPAQSKFFI